MVLNDFSKNNQNPVSLEKKVFKRYNPDKPEVKIYRVRCKACYKMVKRTYQFDICKTCLVKRFKELRKIIDEVRGLSCKA